MYPFETRLAFEPWMLFYVGYIAWMAGLQLYFLLTTMQHEIHKLTEFCLGRVTIVFSGTSFIIAIFVWPLIIIGPPMIVGLGAPWGTLLVMYGFLAFTLYAAGSLQLSHFRPTQT